MTDRPTRPLIMITGAGGDIGRATALVLARRGWSLALAEHPDAAAALNATLEQCHAANVEVWPTTFDVTDIDAVHEAVAAMIAAVGAPVGLFNNAGIQGAFAPIDRYPLADARRVVEVNVIGVLNVLSIVAAAMTSAGSGGAIVNTASMAGVSGAPNMAAYSASKAAVIGLSKSAAKDLAPAAIRVNAISPAFIGPGAMWDRQVEQQAAVGSQYYASDTEAVAAQMIDMVPLRRYGSLDEVAHVVAFLLSDDASYITGVNIDIAGGST